MAKNSIKVKKFIDNQEELIANAALSPGHILDRMSTGKVRVHPTADGPCHVMVALENELEGQEVSDAYAATDPVQVWHPVSGEVFLGRLANGETAAIGSKLVSNGNGELKLMEGTSAAQMEGSIIGTALEAVDMSDSSSADPANLIYVEKF